MGGWIDAPSWMDVVPILLQQIPTGCTLERTSPRGPLLASMKGGLGLAMAKIIVEAITDRVPTEAPRLKDTIWDQDPGCVIRHLAAQHADDGQEDSQDLDLCIDRLDPGHLQFLGYGISPNGGNSRRTRRRQSRRTACAIRRS